ncbi:MAG: DUF4309 domain-containing protein [Megasphaera sp.]|jgi:hypothetical protein|nr:DUF4309 domain-containing protein [Megasphaera sp.]MCH4188444.1 DUF4309 domain-containing protein [Megasphaera sp.]MCH4218155.1 DUF4309 domain-containing protein [Megasphaera sp.]
MLTTIKKLATVVWGCATLLLPAGSCFATLATEQIAVGGVGPGCTTEYVEGVYGTPTSSENISADTGANYVEYNYEGHFLVGFDAGNSQVMYVTSTGDNLKTPAGIGVGMTADALTPAYGPADNLYNYNDKTLYEYSDGNGNTLSFDVQNFYIVSVNVRAAN